MNNYTDTDRLEFMVQRVLEFNMSKGVTVASYYADDGRNIYLQIDNGDYRDAIDACINLYKESGVN